MRHPDVAVADNRGKEFDEAAADAFPSGGDRGISRRACAESSALATRQSCSTVLLWKCDAFGPIAAQSTLYA